MDENKLLGEDKDFFVKANKLNPNFKTFYSKKLFIYHKERDIKKFLIQRFVFGTDLFNIIKFGINFISFQPLLPMLTLTIFIYLFFLVTNNQFKFYQLLFLYLCIQIIIILNIRTYVKKYKIIALTLILINLANISYALGSYLSFFRINNILKKKVYLKSRLNS